ncbi:MAG: tyrosyl-tRNA synthetase [Fusobacteria bacterium]|nr:MAG: tyrosyl-tRNA synthetase [Fusobacteriota bacterium]KAF0227876.1 MAG: tyrosyl-tRNA [Fusobacteriota bacterium]
MEMSLEKQLDIIKRGAVEILPMDELVKKLEKSIRNNKPLKVKLGLDPSAPDIHLGHTVVLQKLKQFQDLGHEIILIIGDFTGRIGDPTGKSTTRKQLTEEEINKNAETYKKQIFRILDPKRTEVVYNSHWLANFKFEDVIRLAAKTTVARILERDDFKKRYEDNQPIGIHEFFYPLMQGYDSVELKADIELGGTDQKFNLLMGRNLQKEYGQEGQIALMMPILEGLDGIMKMSKSLNNYIGVEDSPKEMFGKVMSIKDELIIRYFKLVTQLSNEEINIMEQEMTRGKNPRDYKIKLAKTIIGQYHNASDAIKAEEEFINIFSKNQMPENIDEIELMVDGDGNYWVPKLLQILGLVNSTSDGKRVFDQSGVKINGEKITEVNIKVENAMVIQVGKRKFAKIIIK